MLRESFIVKINKFMDHNDTLLFLFFETSNTTVEMEIFNSSLEDV